VDAVMLTLAQAAENADNASMAVGSGSASASPKRWAPMMTLKSGSGCELTGPSATTEAGVLQSNSCCNGIMAHTKRARLQAIAITRMADATCGSRSFANAAHCEEGSDLNELILCLKSMAGGI